MNKKYLNFIDSYNRSNKRDLFDCYRNPSRKKHDAFRRIIYYAAHTCCLYTLKICSFNAHNFTVGYLVDDNGETYLHYITSCNHYIIPVTETDINGETVLYPR